MRIYTKSGDNGNTSLFNGKIVGKHDLRIDLLGEIDELNARIGLIASLISSNSILLKLQRALFHAGSEIANPEIRFENHINFDELTTLLEKEIDKMDSKLDNLKNFVLPGGSKEAALIHLCRSQTRKVERIFFGLQNELKITLNLSFGRFLNRLSDYFFVLARFMNYKLGKKEILWKGDKGF